MLRSPAPEARSPIPVTWAMTASAATSRTPAPAVAHIRGSLASHGVYPISYPALLMARAIATGDTGPELSTTTRPWTADADTRSTFGSRPTCFWMRTSHDRQVMPATETVVEIVPAAVTTLRGTSMPAGRAPRPRRYSRSSTARRCSSSGSGTAGTPPTGAAPVTGRSRDRVWTRGRVRRGDIETHAPVADRRSGDGRSVREGCLRSNAARRKP